MEQSDRIHALDSVRALALLLGVVFHGSMSFVPGIGTRGWPITDSSPSGTLGVLFFVIHSFRMTLFFVVCGYFAHLLFHRQGAKKFWINRTKRVLLPLLVFWPMMVVAIMATMHWASVKSGAVLAVPSPAPPPALAFPLTHLWFLYLLFGLYALILALRFFVLAPSGWINRLRWIVDSAVAKICTTPMAPALLAIPVAIALCAHPEWHPWDGIPTPDNSLIPNTPALVAFGVAMGLGWMLRRQPQGLEMFNTHMEVHLGAGIALNALCLAMSGLTNGTAELVGGWRALYALCYGAAGWYWTFAIMGVAQHFWRHPSPWRRYLADASYWIYLVHLPLVFALQVAVSEWPLTWALKLPFILVLTLLILLGSYHTCVRSTWLGAWLNGRSLREP